MNDAAALGRIAALLLENLIELAMHAKERTVRASARRNARRHLWRLILEAQQGSEEALEALRAVKDKAVAFLSTPPERTPRRKLTEAGQLAAVRQKLDRRLEKPRVRHA